MLLDQEPHLSASLHYMQRESEVEYKTCVYVCVCVCVCVCHTCYSAGHTPITTTMRSCLIYTSNITALTTNTSTCLAWYSFHCMGSCWGRHLRMVTEGLHQRSTKFGRVTSRMRCFGILVKTENRRSAEG